MRCLLLPKPDFSLKKNCYEVIVKQKIYKRSSNYYLHVCMFVNVLRIRISLSIMHIIQTYHVCM